jgi:hypothetical protein
MFTCLFYKDNSLLFSFVGHGNNMEIKLVILFTHLCWNSLTSVCGNIRRNNHRGNNITTFTISLKEVKK